MTSIGSIIDSKKKTCNVRLKTQKIHIQTGINIDCPVAGNSPVCEAEVLFGIETAQQGIDYVNKAVSNLMI